MGEMPLSGVDNEETEQDETKDHLTYGVYGFGAVGINRGDLRLFY